MTTNDFISNLKLRYPRLNDDPFHITDLEEGLKHFSKGHLEKLWEAFKDNYVLGRAPRWADVNKIAVNVGIARGVKNYLEHAYNVCDVCKTAYSAVGRHCPVCHTVTPYTIRTGYKPSTFYAIREDCGQCKLYTDSATDGVICSDFGTTKTHTMPMCNDCVCHRCCYETIAIIEGSDGDTKKFDKLTSKNKWEDRIREECKAL